MKDVVLASAFGTAVAILLSYVVAWPVAIIAGIAVGYFGYRFRQETWPAWINIISGVKIGRISFMLLLGAAAVLLCKSNPHAVLIVITYGLYLVLGLALLITAGLLDLLFWFILSIVAEDMFSCCKQMIGLGEDTPIEWEPTNNTYAFLLWPLALPLLLVAFCAIVVWRLTISIYCSERVICAISAGGGGLVGYISHMASFSRLETMILGVVSGAVLGAIQYRFIGVPVKTWWAKRQLELNPTPAGIT